MTAYWLNGKLREKDYVVEYDGGQVLTVTLPDAVEKIYCVNSDEYRVTASVVESALAANATTVAYAGMWASPTVEGKSYAETVKIKVMQYGALFGYLDRHRARR